MQISFTLYNSAIDSLLTLKKAVENIEYEINCGHLIPFNGDVKILFDGKVFTATDLIDRWHTGGIFAGYDFRSEDYANMDMFWFTIRDTEIDTISANIINGKVTIYIEKK
jgi:hypothetical protein